MYWWLMPLIPAFRQQRQADPCEFQTSPVCKNKFQCHRKPCPKQTKKGKENYAILLIGGSFRTEWLSCLSYRM